MQIIGIDHSDGAIRCGRIQNIEKPEFIKLKQFGTDKKGIKNLDAWLDECCLKDHASVQIAIVVEDQQGAAIAWRYQNMGYAIVPMTYAGVRHEIAINREKRTIAELIAQKAISSRQRWLPFNQAQLSIRDAFIERENARRGLLENQARNQAYTGDSFDFLFQLTRNASTIHANHMMEAEQAIKTIVEKVPAFKEKSDLLMTIPGMNEMAAAMLAFIMDAYPSKSVEQFSRLLNLHNGASINSSNYRAPELRIARNELYEIAMSSALDMPEVSSLLDRLSTKDKSEKTIFNAICHKYARIAYAVVTKKQAYKA